MAWFRLEGRGAFHRKVVAAGDEAYGAWCRAGQWSSDQLTDGFVPEPMALQINRKPKVWARLVEVGLLDSVDGGYQIHDYLDWNPPSEAERARREVMREKRREAGRAGGKRSGEVRRGEAESKQTGSNSEAKTKQSASPKRSKNEEIDEANAKQNEAPYPDPCPSPEDHTHSSGAPAREDTPIPVYSHPPPKPEVAADPGPPPSGWAEIASADVLLRAVARHPMLATLHGDRRWATDASGGLQARACRAEDADAAVDAFVTGESGSAPEDADALGRWVRANIGRYLKRAKQYGDEERQRARERSERSPTVGFVPAASPPVVGPLLAFAGPWGEAKGKSYRPAPSDAVKAERLAADLRASGVDPTEAIRRAAEQYLADESDLLVGAAHPFALFLTRLNQYDLAPPEPEAPPRPLPEPPPAQRTRRMTPEEQRAHQEALRERLKAS